MTQRHCSQQIVPALDDLIYRGLFDSMDQALAICEILRGENGQEVGFQLLDVNAALETLLRLPRPHLVGRPAASIMPAEDVEQWARVFGRVVETGQPARFEHQISRLARWFMVVASPYSGDRFTVIFDDITSRKRVEKSLRESEEQKAFLLKLSDAFRPLLKSEDIQTTVNWMVADHLKADRVNYVDIEREADIDYFIVRRAQSAADVPSMIGRHPVSLFPAIMGALSAGRAFSLDDVATDPMLCEIERTSLLERHVASLIVVPLVKNGQLVAAFSVQHATPRAWQAPEVQLVGEIAERSWETVERAHAEATLRDREQRLRAVVDQAATGVLEADPFGRMRLVNQRWCEMLGYSEAELLQMNVLDVSAPESLTTTFAAIEALDAGESRMELDMTYRRKDGSNLLATSSVSALRGSDGRLKGLVAVVLDTTDRKRAETALRQSEERFQYIARASHDIHWDIDLATNRMNWSEALEVELGFRADEIGAETAWFFGRIHPEDRDSAVGRLMDVIASNRRSCAGEFRFRRADGVYAHISGRCHIMRDADGRAVRVIGALQDITARYRTQVALRDSEQRHRALIEGIPQLVWRVVDGGRRIWASPQWATHTGLSEEEGLGMGWLRAVHPDDREQTMASWAAARISGTYEAEHRIFRASEGRYRWFQLRGVPLRDENGDIVEWIGTSNDVDDLRSLQEHQSVLVAELQHRTRNLITVVRGISEQTLSSTGSLEEFRTQFNSRLHALSRVQKLLSQAEQAPTTVGDLLRLELDASSADRGNERVRLAGPEVMLPASVVQILALAIHELATNAGKYGAFVTATGRLDVLWSTYTDREGECRLALTWRESGVPILKLGRENGSTREGYGRQLIENALPYSLKAKTTFELGADGACCTIDIPLRSPRLHA